MFLVVCVCFLHGPRVGERISSGLKCSTTLIFSSFVGEEYDRGMGNTLLVSLECHLLCRDLVTDRVEMPMSVFNPLVLFTSRKRSLDHCFVGDKGLTPYLFMSYRRSLQLH